MSPMRRYAASAQDLMTTAHSHTRRATNSATEDLALTTEGTKRVSPGTGTVDRAVDSLGQKVVGQRAGRRSRRSPGLAARGRHPDGAGLDVKANNRVYGSRGVQHRGRLNWGEAKQHRLTFGLRAHEDFMDRHEWRIATRRVGHMVLTAAGDSGSAPTASNRHRPGGPPPGCAALGPPHVDPWVRHERIALSRVDFGDDLGREGEGVQRTNELQGGCRASGPTGTCSRTRGPCLPGRTVGLCLRDPHPTPAEFSVNVELGTRVSAPAFSGQATLFYSDHQNLLGADLTASGGTGTGDLFNGGASMARVELEAVTDILELTGADAFFEDQASHADSRELHLHPGRVHTSVRERIRPLGCGGRATPCPPRAHQFNASLSWQSDTWRTPTTGPCRPCAPWQAKVTCCRAKARMDAKWRTSCSDGSLERT